MGLPLNISAIFWPPTPHQDSWDPSSTLVVAPSLRNSLSFHDGSPLSLCSFKSTLKILLFSSIYYCLGFWILSLTDALLFISVFLFRLYSTLKQHVLYLNVKCKLNWIKKFKNQLRNTFIKMCLWDSEWEAPNPITDKPGIEYYNISSIIS